MALTAKSSLFTVLVAIILSSTLTITEGFSSVSFISRSSSSIITKSWRQPEYCTGNSLTSTTMFSTPQSTFSSSSEQEHAREVFTLVDKDNSETICATELGELLHMLDIDASSDDVNALFKYLDQNRDGEICFSDFSPWYADAVTVARSEAEAVRQVLTNRRTIHNFDRTSVSDEVLRRAVECAISAPNHGMTEPWRFITVGRKTVEKIARLNANALIEKGEKKKAEKKMERWSSIPGWCVVTSRLNGDDSILEMEDYAATCCAVQNFMVSMWSEGVGTKWTSGPITRTEEFADLCGVNLKEERVVGCIWYGFATGGLTHTNLVKRKNGVDDVLSSVP